jgi:mannose-1-phosphate guanylyltransferase / mannose-6-phosphate isomerase
LGSVCDELKAAGIDGAALVMEPMPRNTAPAIAAAALLQAERDPDVLMLVLPADHLIERPAELHQACLNAHKIAEAGKIVTFAITPQGPETGYGYIKSGANLDAGVFAVQAFQEKPDVATAQSYLSEGGYAWNAGIFYFHVGAVIRELKTHAPSVLNHVRTALENAHRSGDIISLEAQSFAQAPSISFDYAVMELTEQAAVAPVEMGWNDVGSFATLWEIGPKDRDDNVIKGNVALLDSHKNYVSTSSVPVALIGVSDLVVVSTPEGLLITKRDRAQDVRFAADTFKL